MFMLASLAAISYGVSFSHPKTSAQFSNILIAMKHLQYKRAIFLSVQNFELFKKPLQGLGF